MAKKNNIACKLIHSDYGTSWVEARNIDQGFEVYCGANEEDLPDEMWVASTKEPYTWRSFANLLLRISEGFIEEDAYTHVIVKGEKGTIADILRIAWSQDQELTEWILAQSDKGIELLKGEFESLVEGDVKAFLTDFLCVINELNADRRLEKLKSAFSPETPDFDIREIYNKMEKRLSWINDVIGKEREARLAPFLEDIDKIADQFDDTPHHSALMPLPSVKSSISQWLCDYVAEHGELPAGTHHVSRGSMGGKLSVGEIDFSKIRAALTEK